MLLKNMYNKSIMKVAMIETIIINYIYSIERKANEI